MFGAVSKPCPSDRIRRSIHRKAFSKHLLSMQPEAPGPELFDHLAACAETLEGTVLCQMLLGGTERPEATAVDVDALNWPVSWLRGDPCDGQSLPATQAVVLSGTTARPLMLDGRRVGMVYEDEDAVYCQLGGILPSDANASRKTQTREFFENMERTLLMAGMDCCDIVRTWLYLDQLLDWYDDFNEVRTRFFQERGVFDKRIPASTGIGAGNRNGMAILGDALAIRPKTDRIQIFPVASPLQCPAIDYKSSFSRAMAVVTPDCRELYVSGTASIAPDGSSIYLDDAEKQVQLTMEVVEAILSSRKMAWSDCTRAIAYFKDLDYMETFQRYCRDNDIAGLPVACLHADVCRDELLFEIEVEAAVSQ